MLNSLLFFLAIVASLQLFATLLLHRSVISGFKELIKALEPSIFKIDTTKTPIVKVEEPHSSHTQNDMVSPQNIYVETMKALRRYQERKKIPLDQPIKFETFLEADNLLNALKDTLRRFGVVTAGDLYNLVGAESTFIDEKIGWTDLTDAKIVRFESNECELYLPKPMDLEMTNKEQNDEH